MINHRDYVVPKLLPTNEPDFAVESALLNFVIYFPGFMPSSIFPRLMVELHPFIRGNDRWRTGMVLHKPNVFDTLAQADIVLCLNSADFIDSDFCYREEFGKALAAHRLGEKTIFPIRLRQTDRQELPLSEIQGVPDVWITSATNRDEGIRSLTACYRKSQTKQTRENKIRTVSANRIQIIVLLGNRYFHL